MKHRNVVERRFAGLLGQAGLYAKRIQPDRLRDILREQFPLAFQAFTEPDPPRPFRFRFEGVFFSVRPETKGENSYWHVRKYSQGRQFNVYVAPSGKLSLELLENACAAILNKIDRHVAKISTGEPAKQSRGES